MNDDDEERDMTEAEKADFSISMAVESSIDLLNQALRMNDWSEMTHEEKDEGSDDFIVIEADGRSTMKVEEALSYLENARDEYMK